MMSVPPPDEKGTTILMILAGYSARTGVAVNAAASDKAAGVNCRPRRAARPERRVTVFFCTRTSLGCCSGHSENACCHGGFLLSALRHAAAHPDPRAAAPFPPSGIGRPGGSEGAGECSGRLRPALYPAYRLDEPRRKHA